MKKFNLISLIAAVLTCFLAQQVSATPHCLPCPYSCNDLGLGHKDCSQASIAGGICCLDLTQKGLELAQARERITGSSAAGGYQGGGSVGGGCPAGFHQSGSRCSPQDRQHGCKDLRGPSGQTCISGRAN